MAKNEGMSARPANDAYTGLLILSLVATVVSCALLYVDQASYPDARPKIQPPSVVQNVEPPG
jgi:hypothetical protein